MSDWKQELRALKLAYLKKHHLDFYEKSGGDRMRTLPYSDKTTNKLTAAVIDWLKYSEQYANRISSTGLMRKVNGKMQYTHGSSNLGTADVDSIVKNAAGIPIPVKIEIKNVNTRDRMGKHQAKEKARIERAGGVYLVVPSMEFFVAWYMDFTGTTTILSQSNSLSDGSARQ